MIPASRIDRIVLVVMDGVRAEAVDRLALPTLGRMISQGAWTLSAETVTPSVTAAAMTSLLTGVPPEQHGIGTQGFGIPRDRHGVPLLTHLLARSRFPVSLYLARIPLRYRWLATRLGVIAGANHVCATGDNAREIVASARADQVMPAPGLAFMHWPDADRAGHRHGWGSAAYDEAVVGMDGALGELVEDVALFENPGTLLVVCSDHGGGGTNPLDHNSDHPADTTIPIVLAGSGVVPVQLDQGVTLLDIPPTILWSLGLDVPFSYAGRPLREAFRMEARAA